MLDKINQPLAVPDDFSNDEERDLLELEARYCSHGDTVHYTDVPKIFERCEGSLSMTGRTRPSSICRCGTRRSISATPIRA